MIATARSIKSLPADLFGLGKFESNFELNLPDEKEREEILNI